MSGGEEKSSSIPIIRKNSPEFLLVYGQCGFHFKSEFAKAGMDIELIFFQKNQGKIFFLLDIDELRH